MASNNEVLSLTAQVIDRYSAPIRDMTRSLRTMSEHGKAVHVEGARYAKQHRDSFEDLRKTARETGDQFKNVLNPTLVGLETGLAINSLNAWIEAGKRANITSEAMIGSLTSANEKLSQFDKRRDSALQQFFAVNMDKPVMANLYNALRAAKGDREKQDRLILDTYEKLQEADQHLLEEAFGEQNFRRSTRRISMRTPKSCINSPISK